jgi:hypothetical protein
MASSQSIRKPVTKRTARLNTVHLSKNMWHSVFV